MPTEAINALIQACLIGLVIGTCVMSLVRLRGNGLSGLLWPVSFALGAMGGYLRILTGEWPNIPPREATEGLLLFVIPTAVLIDALDGSFKLRRSVRWTLWTIAAIATPLMLFFKPIGDLIEGASMWTPLQAMVHMGCMVAGLMTATFAVGTALRSTGASVDSAGSNAGATPALDTARHLPAALVPVGVLAGVTLLSSGSYRLGALALASATAPLAGAYLSLQTGCPQIHKKIGPLIFILPLGATVVMGHELADLSLQNTVLLLLGIIAPTIVSAPKFRNALRQPWQAFAAMVLMGLIPALAAAVPAALAAMRAAQSSDGY